MLIIKFIIAQIFDKVLFQYAGVTANVTALPKLFPFCIKFFSVYWSNISGFVEKLNILQPTQFRF